LNIFTTWHTKDLPPEMAKAVNLMKSLNPEFKYNIYDENDCIEFIKENFDSDVLYSYNNLIPLSYKSDLWRYCVLYIYGGIYIDIKFIPVDGFKLITLTGSELYGLDMKISWDLYNVGIYTGLIACKPGDKILLNCIKMIVRNVKKKYYGTSALSPTGPLLLGLMYFKEYNDCNNLKYILMNDGQFGILYKNNIILKQYDSYRDEQKKYVSIVHYSKLWKARQIYNN
jgi:mannosyltransferase OCH1-like enzyme